MTILVFSDPDAHIPEAFRRQWRISEFIDGDLHVYPLCDEKPHTVEDCPCEPRIEICEFNNIIVHKAFDFREVLESGLVDEIER